MNAFVIWKFGVNPARNSAPTTLCHRYPTCPPKSRLLPDVVVFDEVVAPNRLSLLLLKFEPIVAYFP